MDEKNNKEIRKMADMVKIFNKEESMLLFNFILSKGLRCGEILNEKRNDID